MSASNNAVHPQDSPITSQPGSKANSRPGTQENDENQVVDNDGGLLPTPRNFPLTPSDCPPGLGCLVELEYIFMKQSFASIEDHPENALKFEVLTVFGHRIFVGVEKKEASNKMFCTGASPFSICIFSKTSETHFRKEVLQISGHPGSFGCGAEIEIKYDQKKLGRVEQDNDFSILRYTIQNSEGKDVLKITGPKHNSCCSSMSMGKVVIHEFDIFLNDHTHVGRIAKHWSDIPDNKEVFTRSDIWGVKFPQAYDVKLKALLMSTCFLMFYQFSEKQMVGTL